MTNDQNREINILCTACGFHAPFTHLLPECPECGETLLQAMYDLERLKRENWLGKLKNRPANIWRYRELLPVHNVDEHVVTMGEGGTPLIKSTELGPQLGLANVYIKDERQNPTGSFKDRQASVAISVLNELGIHEAAVASTGNVGIAYAAYAARADIKLWVFLTSLVPAPKMREAAVYGGEVITVTGTYDQTKIIASRFARSKGLHLDKGLKSIAAIESMKTLAFEITEQLGRAPDWYIQAVSGGMGPVGVIKGFQELKTLGAVDKIPAIGVVQSAGCAPMVHAFKAGQSIATPVEKPHTLITTLSTGDPGRAYGLLWDHIQEHGGYMESATDEEAFTIIQDLAQQEGMSVEPATAVAFAGFIKMAKQGIIKPDDVVVINASGHTLSVEKQILGDQWAKQVDISHAEGQISLPEEGLLAALENVQKRVQRVLILDDNRDAARLIMRILQARGNYDVKIAHGGEEGLSLASAYQPDLIITDLMMPEVDGFRVIDVLKSDPKLCDIPIIVLTAKELTPHERKRLSGQILSVLQKGSFMDEKLLQEIVDALN